MQDDLDLEKILAELSEPEQGAAIPEDVATSPAPAAPPEPDKTEFRRARKRLREEQEKKRRLSVRRSAPFFTALAIVTVLAWLLPLRPTVSESEKRPLNTFPEFSFAELFSGEYFSGIDAWFSDTFTFRESWIKATQSFKKIYGLQTVAIYGDVPVNDAVPVVNTAKPSAAVDSGETPAPTTAPTPTPTLAAETPKPEQTPEPTPAGWKGDSVADDDFVGHTTVLQIGDATYNYPGFNQYNGERYAQLMNKLGDSLVGKANLYCLIVPENASYMLSPEDRLKYGFTLEEDAFAYVYSLMNENVHPVNVLDILQQHNDEYLAFRTDHHWTQRGAYYSYVEWCKVAGKEPVDINSLKEVSWDGFLGSYYYFAEQSKLLSDHPDEVFAYYPTGDVHMYMDFTETDYQGEEHELYIDRSACAPGAKYMAFLGADNARVTFINNDITDGSACVVLKNSFGNPFVYFLTEHYQYVYVLDLRYYGYRNVVSFVDNFNVQDVLYVHGSGMCWDENGIGVLSWLIK